MTTSNKFQLAIAEQSAQGAPATAGFQRYGVNDYAVRAEDGREFPQTIDGLRSFQEYLLLSKVIRGTIPFHCAPNNDAFYECGLLSKFQRRLVAEPGAVTSITGASSTIATAGGLAWAEGDIARLSGSSVRSNNARLYADTGTGADSFVATTALTNDPTPAGARLKLTGKRFAAGAVSAFVEGSGDATVRGLDGAGNAFASFAPDVGDTIRVGATFSVGGRFDNNTARIGVILEKTDDRLVLGDLGDDWAVDAGAGKQIEIFFGDELDYGDDLTIPYQHHEFVYGAQNEKLYISFYDLAGQSLSENFQRQQAIISTLGVDGFGDTSAAAPTASYAASGQGLPFTSGEHVGSVIVGGVKRAKGNKVKTAEYNIENELTSDGGLEDVRDCTHYAGDFKLTVPFTAQFGTGLDWQNFRGGSKTSLLIPTFRGNEGYIRRLWAGQYASGDIAPQGRNNIGEFRGELMALDDPDTGKSYSFTKFEDAGLFAV